jgi:predicted nucleic acid-binding protein
MRAALDTNLLVYAEGFGDVQRVRATRALLEQLNDADLVVPLQCLGELFRVLTGKLEQALIKLGSGRLACRNM